MMAAQPLIKLSVIFMLFYSLVMSEDTVWRDQFYDGRPKLEKSLCLCIHACYYCKLLKILWHMMQCSCEKVIACTLPSKHDLLVIVMLL